VTKGVGLGPKGCNARGVARADAVALYARPCVMLGLGCLRIADWGFIRARPPDWATRWGFAAVANWLFKEEPDHYSFADLEREGTTLWDGVTNAMARIHLRKVRKGDRILYYHTGKEKAVVAEMEALADATPDPNASDPKAAVVLVKPVRRLQRPVPLREIKADSELADWDLVRNSRLSIMPVSKEQWRRVMEMTKRKS